MFKHYLIIAFRNLMRNKFQTIFSIVGLAVAFFVFGFCMYFVYGFLSMDKYYENHDRVYRITENGDYGSVSPKGVAQIEGKFPEVEAIIRLFPRIHPFSYGTSGWAEELNVIECDTTLHTVFTPRLIAGSWTAAENTPNSLLITESYARKFFGSAEKALGEQFELVGGSTYTVQAVVEDLAYNNTMIYFSKLFAWVMNDVDGYIAQIENGSEYIYMSDARVLLRKGTDFETFRKHFVAANIKSSFYITDADGNQHFRILTVDPTVNIEWQFESNAIFALVMMIIAGPGLLILLSALSNFFHLLVSNIMMRRREYALRRTQGAHTFDLWLMVSTQVIFTLIVVGFTTFIIIDVFSPMFQINVGEKYSLDTNTMLRQSAWHIGALLILGFGVAWLAVSRIRKDSLQESMKTSTGRKPGKHVGRNILMGWQMVIGLLFLTLLSAVILQIRTNDRAVLPWLTNQEKAEIIKMPSYTPEIESELKSIPSVKGTVTIFDEVGHNSFEISMWRAIMVEGANGDSIEIGKATLGTDGLRFINVPLLKGEWPERSDQVVIDQRCADRTGYDVGQVVDVGSFVTITGIIDNAAFQSQTNNGGENRMSRRGCIYLNDAERNELYVKSYPGKGEEMREELGKYLAKRAGYPEGEIINLYTLWDEIKERNNLERAFLGIFWAFAIIAMIINMLGIYSAITVDTAARRKEMAIRKINGAKAKHIALLFARLYVIELAVAAAIVVPLSYVLFSMIAESGYREHFNYGFVYYTCVLLIMVVFVALTVGMKVWQISHINPSQIVKSE